MKSVKLVDSSFRHGESACHDRAPANFGWKWLDPEDGYDFPGETVFFTDKRLEDARFYSAGRKVAWVLEPRDVQPERYEWIAENHRDFDVVLTFDRDLIAQFPKKFRFFAFGGCWIRDEDIAAYPKTKRCSIIASAKAVTEGQKLRHEVIQTLGGQFDVYGRGYQPVDHKVEALRDYEFTVVIENSRQDDYFSEKLIDALATGTVPLYWGTPRVGEYFPNGVLSFETVEELAELISTAQPDALAIQQNLETLQAYKLPEDWIWENYRDLFEPTRTMKKRPSASLADLFTGGRRHREKVRELESRLEEISHQRDKTRAERERYRAERDQVREERNVARAERDQARAGGGKATEKAPLPDYYQREFEELTAQAQHSSHEFEFAKNIPILHERDITLETATGHYYNQDLYVAQRVHETQPEKHVDIASRMDGFVAHVASFREIEVFDIRDVATTDPRIRFRMADLMDLDESLIEYTDSLSCLHAIEHFGLGRYGDPIDYEGHLKGIANMARIVKPGGRFFLSTPIGKQRIHFNAHRVFNVRYLIELCSEWGDLEKLSWVGDDGDLRRDVTLNDSEIDNNFGCHYGCGIFEWIKR